MAVSKLVRALNLLFGRGWSDSFEECREKLRKLAYTFAVERCDFMRRLPPALAVASGFLWVTAAALSAQEPSRGPDGRTSYHVSGIEVLPIAGKPFFGKDSIEWTRKLEDGSTVSTHLDAVVARDSEGRIYRERRHFVPASSTKESRLEAIIVYDPTSKTKTECTLATRECSITAYGAPKSFRPMPVGTFAEGTRHLTREGLGNNVVDDLNVIGTRETTYIDQGAVGNDRPLVSTREFWYSPDLETNVSVTRQDPTEGTQVIHLIDLSRSEPDAALFAIPSGYAMHDLRQPAQTLN
jgi:hypothetical protein